MSEYIDFEGKTTQDALDLAVEKTGVSPSNLKFEILNQGGGGIFGISFKKAKIRVFLESDPKEKSEKLPLEDERKKESTDRDFPEWGKHENKGITDTAIEKIEKKEVEKTEASVKDVPVIETAEKAEKVDDPLRSTWAQPSRKKEIPKKDKKVLTRDDLVKPAVPKDRIDVDLRDDWEIRRAERAKKRVEKNDRGEKRIRVEKPERIDNQKAKEIIDTQPPQDIEEEQKTVAAEALRDILRFWMEDAEIESGWRDGKIYLNIIGDGSGLLIGRKGQTLDAIQFIVGKIVDRKAGRHIRLTVDTENYRKRRIQMLERTALELAEKALQTKKGQTTGPMNPHDRRIVHLTLQDDGRFKTRSRGEGTYKRVYISVK